MSAARERTGDLLANRRGEQASLPWSLLSIWSSLDQASRREPIAVYGVRSFDSISISLSLPNQMASLRPLLYVSLRLTDFLSVPLETLPVALQKPTKKGPVSSSAFAFLESHTQQDGPGGMEAEAAYFGS